VPASTPAASPAAGCSPRACPLARQTAQAPLAAAVRGAGAPVFPRRWEKARRGARARFERDAILAALARLVPPRRRLLVVDDDPQVVDLVRQLLEGEPYEVEAAMDSLEALEAVARQRPEVIL